MAINNKAEAARTKALVDTAVTKAIEEANKKQEEKEKAEAEARQKEYEALEAANA